MSGINTATLKDGSQISFTSLFNITDNIQALGEESTSVLADLLKKCLSAEHRFIQTSSIDSERTLKEYGLLDETGKVHADVQKIVLNSITQSGRNIIISNPLLTKKTSQLDSKKK